MRRDQYRREQEAEDRQPMAPVLDHYNVAYVPDMAGWQKVLCPIHDEDRPSCSVNVEEGAFNCHACQQKGDVYTLVMIKENCAYPAAERRVSELTGTSRKDLRGDPARVPGDGVPDGTGYVPRFRRAVPAGVRFRTATRP